MFKKLPFGSSHEETKKAAETDEDGESLTTILTTPDERAALTILVAECTEVMRQALLDIFDAKQTGTKADLVSSLVEAEPTSQSDTNEARVAKEQTQKELEEREKELSSAKFAELKQAALKHFDEWSASVIGRIGEVVNSREEAAKQKQEAHPPSQQQEESVKGASPPRKFNKLEDYGPEVDEALVKVYPPVKTPLSKRPEEQKALILHSILLLMLSLQHYHAHSRILLLRLSTSLGLSINYLGADESKVARVLLAAVEDLQAEDETKKRAEENQTSRRWKVGLAGVAGAALIGVTGGLAAPLLAAGVGTMMGGLGLGATAAAGYLGAIAGSGVLVGGLFGAYGGRMTSKMMDQYAREVEDFAFIPIKPTSKPRKIEKEYRRLRVGIGVSGWLTDQHDIVDPWKPFGFELESFALRWEIQALINLGNGLTTLMKSAAWGYAKKEIIKHTVFAALTAGLWPLGLLKVSKIIENPWSVASYRAKKAGEILADALINKAQGERPVTLVGYSLGAKVIYTCLQRLAERRAFGLVESVILMGAPSPSTSADWRLIRAVVAGRVVNVYSTEDYLLGYLYRSAGLQYGVAGLQAIENVKGVESVDVTDVVSGHTSYRLLTGPILQRIGFENIDLEELEKEKVAFKADEDEQKQENEKAENIKVDDDVNDEYVQGLEKEVEKKTEQSYTAWAQEKMMSAGTNASVAYEKAKAQWSSRNAGSANDYHPTDTGAASIAGAQAQ